MRTLLIFLIGVTLGLVIATALPALAQTHPHDYIKSFKIPGDGRDCCGEADCVRLYGGAFFGLKVGDKINLPAIGPHPERIVTIKVFYPSPDRTSWGCHTGCMFIPGMS